VNRLFVYGIFLSERTGSIYDFKYVGYGIVRDMATQANGSSSIVQAVPAPGLALTGLIVEVPEEKWDRLDRLEHGYKRIWVHTSEGLAWMYASEECEGENYNPHWWKETRKPIPGG